MPVERLPKGMPRRGTDGRFPAYAWPGGYPIMYVFEDGECCCSDCANRWNGSEARIGGGYRDGWALIGFSIHYEGPPEICAHCGVEIGSAYGDPDSEEKSESD